MDSGNPLPTIFLTAQNDLPERIQTPMEQAAGVLSKPVSARDLVKAIEGALKT
jgi:FixJ family two-component response regulator